MALQIPTTAEIVAQAVASFESNIGQTVPSMAKAFFRVMSGVLGAQFTTLYKYGVERTLQNLALTATGADLDLIGLNYGVTRRAGVAAVLTTRSVGNTVGTPLTAATDWIGDANNVRYNATASTTVSAVGALIFYGQAQDVGTVGNLEVGDTLNIGSPISGIENTTTVTEVFTTGVDRETDASYRRKVLNEIRTVGGGGNGVDYRTWAEEVEGVAGAYPYSGKPLDGSLGTSYPGDRTVFVKAETSLGTDNIASSALLASVRDSINTDPDTGLTRVPLGMTDSTLFILSVTKTPLYVEIRNLDEGNGNISDVKDDITTALEQYFATVVPYVDGVDPEVTKNNVVTDLTVSQTVQGVIAAVGGSSSGIGFGTASGSYSYTYTLGQGELVSLAAVTYV